MTWIGRDALGRVTDFDAESATTDAGGDITVGGTALVERHTVTLTDAQIKALPTTAVEVVPPVTDGIIAPLLFAIRPDWWTDNPNAAAYTNFATDNSTGFAFTDPVTGNDVSEYLEFATASNQALLSIAGPFPKPDSSRAAFIFHPLLGEYVSSGYFRQRFGAADVLNSISLYAYNTGGDFTGGHADNTMTVTVHYVVLSV